MSTVVSIEQQQLDNTIKSAASGNFVADNGVVKSEFYELGNRVVFGRNGRRVTWTPSAMKYVDSFGTEDTIFTVQDVPLEVKANYARYNRAMPDVDDWFTQDNDRLKHSILLQGFQRDPMPWLSEPIDFVFGGRLEFDPDLRIRINGDMVITGAFDTSGQIEIINPAGEVVFILPPVVVYDSGIPERASTGGKYRVTSNENGVLAFDIVVDNGWVSSVDRVYPIIIDPTTVVAAAYSTAGNGGRKTVSISNGTRYSAVLDTAPVDRVLRFYRSTDNGVTWTTDRSMVGYRTAYFALDTNLTTVFVLSVPVDASPYSRPHFQQFDGSTASTSSISGAYIGSVADTETAFGAGASIIVDGPSTIHAFYSSKNASFTNSFNIRYTKSNDGGVTWAAVTQLSTLNIAGADHINPCAVLRGINPSVSYQLNQGITSNDIEVRNFDVSAWSGIIVPYDAGGNNQANSNGLVKKYGTNIGRFWILWDGVDPTEGKRNIRASYSDDGGATWSVAVKITTGNTIDRQKPVLAENINGDVYVFYQDGAGISFQKCANGTTTFSGVTSFASSGTNPAVEAQAVNGYLGVIYMDASTVKFDKIIFNTAPSAPTLITEPNFDATIAQTLQWTFSDPDAGNTQSAYQLLIKRVSDGVTVVDTGKVASTVSSRILAANTLVNNTQYQWQVKTWDNVDAVGPYSALSTFWTSGQPTTSITAPLTDGETVPQSSLTPTWSFSDPESEGQTAYQIKLTSSADVVLWDSGKTSDVNARSRTIGYNLSNNTSYKIKLTVWDGKDVPSVEVVRTMNVSYTPPATPIIIFNVGAGYLNVAINNPVPSGTQPATTSNDLYRRKQGESTWIRIATGIANNGSLNDYAVASGVTYEYMTRVFGVNNTSMDSAAASRIITFTGIWLHDVSDPAGTVRRYEIDGAGRNVDLQPKLALNQYAGRARPVSVFGTSADGRINSKIEMTRDSGDYEALDALVRRTATICFRDGRGQKMFGVIPRIPTAYEKFGYSTTIEVVETAYSEVI